MQRIAVFLADEPTHRRLQMAMAEYCRVEQFSPTADAIQDFVDRGNLFAAVVDLRGLSGSTRSGSRSGDAERAIALIAELRARYPLLPIVGYVDLTPQQAREILFAAHAGITDIILGEYDDTGFITRRMLSFRAINDVQARAFATIGHLVPADVAEFFSICLTRASEALMIDDIAVLLQVSKKTIAKRHRKHQLPQPYRIVGWGRVLTAIRWLDDTKQPIEKTARELMFTDGTGLRNFLRRYVGCSLEVLQQKGGFDYALRLFMYELQTSRTMEPSQRPLSQEPSEPGDEP